MPEPLLIDTAPLRDQRTMVDVTHPDGTHRTPEEVADAWARWAEREGLPVRRRQGDFSTDLRASRKTIIVFVSGGKWIGDCPDCGGGVAGWPCNPKGCCLDCGTIFNLQYPPEPEIKELTRLLGDRPELQRNYFPQNGEDIALVRREQELYQYAAAVPAGAIDIATLKDVLSAREYEKLVKAGLA